MNEASAELTRLRERVKELEAENARLKESLWGNDQWNGSRVPHGWRCNACGRVNSPGVRHCSCNGNKTLRERVSTP